MHTLAVEKEGFIQFRKDVEISPKQETRVQVELQPSEDFRRHYVEGAQFKRNLAWGGLALGALGLGGSAAMYVLSSAESKDLRSDIEAYNRLPAAERTSAAENKLSERRSGIGKSDSLILGLGVVGIAGLVGGSLLYFLGDDPAALDAAPRFEVGTDISSTGHLDQFRVAWGGRF